MEFTRQNQASASHVSGLKAVILDMDGVVTRSRVIHRRAWKHMFNEYFVNQNHSCRPVDDEDYTHYLDGRPRYDGVLKILESRNLELPYGSPEDPPEAETVCGLGNRKNRLFREYLARDGVEVYVQAVARIHHYRENGLRTAIVSSSKNCADIINRAGISELFDVRVDGVTAIEKGLRGKPYPDYFTEAARMLDVLPENCALFEDAITGVQAGTIGNFGLVVGVNRTDSGLELLLNGADIVIEDFTVFDLLNVNIIQPYFNPPAPNIMTIGRTVEELLAGSKAALFLDFDGTLSPIVKHPEDAVISDSMRDTLKRCSRSFTVAIVSGRDMDDVKQKTALESCIYAGSHGFRISGPNGLYREHEQSAEILPQLDRLEKALHEKFGEQIDGIRIDRKRYAIAVHYRNVKEEEVIVISTVISDLLKGFPGFKKSQGKKIIEVRPDIDWHKGKAIRWIMHELHADASGTVPVYIGDDITDEDGFRAVNDSGGISILVGFHGSSSTASYSLKNVYQVELFLNELAKLYHE